MEELKLRVQELKFEELVDLRDYINEIIDIIREEMSL